jgi:hypothetical protein
MRRRGARDGSTYRAYADFHAETGGTGFLGAKDIPISRREPGPEGYCNFRNFIQANF